MVIAILRSISSTALVSNRQFLLCTNAEVERDINLDITYNK